MTDTHTLHLKIDPAQAEAGSKRFTSAVEAVTRGQRLNFDQIASEYQAIAELDAASKETDRLRAEISEKNKPAKSAGGGGGGRAGGLSEEAKATNDLNKSLKERLTGLEQERVTLIALAQNQFESAEAAELFAQAMVAGGGAVAKDSAGCLADSSPPKAILLSLQASPYGVLLLPPARLDRPSSSPSLAGPCGRRTSAARNSPQRSRPCPATGCASPGMITICNGLPHPGIRCGQSQPHPVPEPMPERE